MLRDLCREVVVLNVPTGGLTLTAAALTCVDKAEPAAGRRRALVELKDSRYKMCDVLCWDWKASECLLLQSFTNVAITVNRGWGTCAPRKPASVGPPALRHSPPAI